jgi:ABC-type transporter Mla MlaB component
MAELEIIGEIVQDVNGNNVHTLILSGHLTLGLAYSLGGKLDGLLVRGNKIIIDMSDISRVDGSGLGELISIMNSGVDYCFVLCGGIGEKIIELFEVIKVPIPTDRIASDIELALKLFEVKVAGS